MTDFTKMFWATLILAALLTAAPAWAVIYELEGDVLPTDPSIGWVKHTGSDMTLVTEEGRTCIYQNTTDLGTSAYGLDVSGIDHSQDIVIEVSMKIGTNGGEGTGGGYLWFANGTYVWGLNVSKPDDGTYGNNNNGYTWGQPGYAQIYMYDNRQAQTYWDYDDADLSEDTLQPGFHTFRWEISAADPTSYTFSVDGIPGSELWHRTTGDYPLQQSLLETDTRIIVGDWSTKVGSGKEIWYDYIHVYNGAAPTPKNPGDVDEDNFVGGADLTQILTNWGNSGVTWTDGDVDPYNDGITTGDDFIGGGDYTAVLTAWGTSYSPGSVPEPATMSLMLIGGLVGLLRRR